MVFGRVSPTKQIHVGQYCHDLMVCHFAADWNLVRAKDVEDIFRHVVSQGNVVGGGTQSGPFQILGYGWCCGRTIMDKNTRKTEQGARPYCCDECDIHGLFGLGIRPFKSSAECLSGIMATAHCGHAAEGMRYPTTWKLKNEDRLETQCIIHMAIAAVLAVGLCLQLFKNN